MLGTDVVMPPPRAEKHEERFDATHATKEHVITNIVHIKAHIHINKHTHDCSLTDTSAMRNFGIHIRVYVHGSSI
jgi:hypothetical protein